MGSADSRSGEKPLTWSEPRSFRKREVKGLWKTAVPIIGLTAGAVIAMLCIATRLGAGAEATPKLLITGGAIIFMCLVFWWFAYHAPFIVNITHKAITIRDFSDTLMVYRFGAVDHCEICHAILDGQTMPVLLIALKNGDRETFGIAPSVSIDTLCSTLKQRGVSVVIKAEFAEEEAEQSTPPYSEPAARTPQG